MSDLLDQTNQETPAPLDQAGESLVNSIQNTPPAPTATVPNTAVKTVNDSFLVPQENETSIIAPRGKTVRMLDPAEMWKAQKTMPFSRLAVDFLNASQTLGIGTPYAEQQLLGAYMTSVYLFAALRRVSNLISRVKIVAEIKENDVYNRIPETALINRVFEKEGAEVLSKMYLNYAIYGATAIVKLRTRKAVMEANRGTPIYAYKDGAVGGLFVLDKPLWDLDEDYIYGSIKGLHVSQATPLIGERVYLDREEFVYVTDWNPENPNRGRSITSVAIHEAVANASIAQWMSEYFTRGAMPFIMVALEEDPNMLTESDLLKYKRQFEDHWQGMGASLRSVFFDRTVNVEQVGIPASEVAAPELNEAALEGIAAAVGLDRELVVTPQGGSQERHAILVKRAWDDTIIPLAEKFLASFNRDLGLPDNMRLTLDLSEIDELHADREDKANTEISIYGEMLQSYNETRTRLKMVPVDEFHGWYNYDGKPTPIARILEVSKLPAAPLIDYAVQLWEADLAKRSEVIEMLGRTLPKDGRDGYRSELENEYDLISQLWQDDMLLRSQVLGRLHITPPPGFEDGYRSELERGADYGDFVLSLWSDNLLKRSEVIKLLDMGMTLPLDAEDGYQDDIGKMRETVADLWNDNLITKRQAMDLLGIEAPKDMIDGFADEVNITIDRRDNYSSYVMDLWGDNLITRAQALDMLSLSKPSQMIDGFSDEIDGKTSALFDRDKDTLGAFRDMWNDNLVTRAQVLQAVGVEMPKGAIDGYSDEVEPLTEAKIERVIQEQNAELEEGGPDGPDGPDQPNGPNEPDEPDDTGGGGTFGSIGMNSMNGMNDIEDKYIEDSPSIEGAEEDWLDIEDTGDNYYPPYFNENVDIFPNLPVDEDYDDTFEDVEVYPVDIHTPILHQLRNSPNYPYSRSDGPYDYVGALGDANVNYRTPLLRPTVQSGVVFGTIPVYEIDEINETALDKLEQKWQQAFTEIVADIVEDMFQELIEDDDDIFDEIIEIQELPIITETEIINAPDEEKVTPSVYDEIENTEQVIDKNESDQINVDLVEHTAEDISAQQSPEAYAALWIGENEQLKMAQEQLRSAVGDTHGFTWQNPDAFHVTLIHTSSVGDGLLGAIYNLLPKKIARPTLKVGPLTVFNQEDSTVFVLQASAMDALDNLHQKFNMAFNAYNVPVSDYHKLGEFKGHITLAYAPPNTPAPNMDTYFDIEPDTIYISRGDYEQIYEIPLYDAELDEIPNEPIEDVQRRLENIAYLTNIYREKWIYILNLTASDLDVPEWAELPTNIIEALEEFGGLKNKKAIEACKRAIQAGWFDEDAVALVNPIAMYIDVKAQQPTLASELKAWERATIQNGRNKGLRFEVKLLPEAIENYVKMELSGMINGDKQSIKDVFAGARKELNKADAPSITSQDLKDFAVCMLETGDPDLIALVDVNLLEEDDKD